MPVHLPGGRKRATPVERRYFAQQNTGTPCAAPHCPRSRIWTSRWCATHRNKAGIHGHPEGRALDHKLVKKWRGIMRCFLDRYGDTPQVQGALKFMDSLLKGDLTTRSSVQRSRPFLKQKPFLKLDLSGVAGWTGSGGGE